MRICTCMCAYVLLVLVCASAHICVCVCVCVCVHARARVCLPYTNLLVYLRKVLLHKPGQLVDVGNEHVCVVLHRYASKHM